MDTLSALSSKSSVLNSSGSQISGAIVEKEHGLFTYYLLKGMGGDADQNNDQAVNLSELQIHWVFELNLTEFFQTCELN